ncbi:hypothetical protein KM176_24205 [Pseudooceanicola sp. CBS1P-1]|uniref:Uncharacterized protein n=1 Tax=Pseudooceanicola albus TaxID=2692189 RepID=A0A6L7GAG1_9RHOB|nr:MULTISPECIES: hypothetical protein [Pseudooceanicola]MBT9386965.1 hypothetical protein [Pseudooceanicola endophyticus]MXN21184.1 hypothetical protein [Pseudooceanicola albus]
MAYSQTQVDALRAALARGATSYKLNGEEVTYASLVEMRRQLREMEAEIAGRPTSGPVLAYARSTRGL